MAPRYRYEMPRMLREAGYYTFGIGKMHWHPQRERHGFHATLLDESGRVEDVGFVSDYRQWFRLHAPGLDPDSTGIGWNDHGAGSYVFDERLHPTRWTGGTACELIRNYDAESGQPLFLKVSFARPHSPYDPPARFLQLYADREIPAPAVGDWCGKYAAPADPARVAPDAPFGNFGEEYARRSRRHYYASVTFVDEEIGKIIRALKEKGMYDRSLIIFVADHGDMLGDHHHWRKTYPYEGSSHIPFLVNWPAGSEGMLPRVDVPVELRYVLPTMLAAAGADVPADMDGRPVQGPAPTARLLQPAVLPRQRPVWGPYRPAYRRTLPLQPAVGICALLYSWFFNLSLKIGLFMAVGFSYHSAVARFLPCPIL